MHSTTGPAVRKSILATPHDGCPSATREQKPAASAARHSVGPAGLEGSEREAVRVSAAVWCVQGLRHRWPMGEGAEMDVFERYAHCEWGVA